jgi:hypothetical protein
VPLCDLVWLISEELTERLPVVSPRRKHIGTVTSPVLLVDDSVLFSHPENNKSKKTKHPPKASHERLYVSITLIFVRQKLRKDRAVKSGEVGYFTVHQNIYRETQRIRRSVREKERTYYANTNSKQ